MNNTTIFKKLRLEHGICQKELAAYLNVSISTVSNYENGMHAPDLCTLVKLADFYHVTTDYLLERTKYAGSLDVLNQCIANQYTVSDFLNLLEQLSPRGRIFLVYILCLLEKSFAPNT